MNILRKVHAGRPATRAPLVIALGLVLVAGVAATARVLTGTSEGEELVFCHSRADPASRHEVAVRGHGDDAFSPTALCAPYYERRHFLAEHLGERPPLVACRDRGAGLRVFPSDAAACSRLGLARFDDERENRDEATISAGFAVADEALLDAQEKGMSAADCNDPSVFDCGYPRCIRPATAQRVVAGALARKGLHGFRVRVDRRLAESACTTLVGVPERFDGRMVELEGEGTDRTPSHDEVVAIAREQDRKQRRTCDHPLGRTGSRDATDLEDALACRAHRYRGADPREANCWEVDRLRAFARRVLERVGLRAWSVIVAGGPPSGSKYRLGYLLPPEIERDAHRIRLTLSEHCLG